MLISDCKSHTDQKAIKDHNNFKPIIQDQLLQALSPFEKLFDEKLGLCAGKPLYFRVKNDHNLRCQMLCNILTMFINA